MEALTPCLYETHSNQVFTQMQALTYIGNKVKSPSMKKGEDFRKKAKDQEGRDILVKIVLAHVPVS